MILAKEVVRVSVALEHLIAAQAESGPPLARLEELERTRAHWQAEMEALLLKAESTLKSASNAESRSRTMMKHAEKLTDPFTEEGEDVEVGIPPQHAPVGNGETVQPVHADLGVLSPKQFALRMKFL